MSRARPCAAAVPLLLVLFSSPVPAQDPFGRRGPPPSPLFEALDRNGDGELSADELDEAVAGLLTLDRDGDRNLSMNELQPERGGRRGGFGGPGFGGPGFGGPGMGRMDPVLQALDLDGDGELFLDEVTTAARALDRLDRNFDDVVTADELRSSGDGGPGRGFGGFGRPNFGADRDGQPYDGVPRPEQLREQDGSATVRDLDAFRELSYRGEEVMIDTHLADLEFVKFQLEGAGSDDPRLYFMNTKRFRAHPMFMQAIGLGGGFGGRGGRGADTGRMRGVLVYRPTLRAPSGGAGLFTFEFEPNDAYEYDMVRVAFDLLEQKAPVLRGRLAYNLLPRAKQQWATEKHRYEQGQLPVFEPEDVYGDVAFLPLHEGESFGLLRLMERGERPGQRDIVVYRSLPNEMPRTAGVLTAVRQTPLSHVNLRCVQDDVPNAYVDGIAEHEQVRALLGRYVRYVVRDDGWLLEEADAAAVEAHFEALRPKQGQVPPRDLSVREIRPFAAISFDDAAVFGVKASNLATLKGFDFPSERTPDGYAVPFSFYDEFMRHNGFYDGVRALLADEQFRRDADVREQRLTDLRDEIERGEMPEWMLDALEEVHGRFPDGQSVRCRSSTNNEDLPGFSGAGLYDSFTHKKGEGHLGKSIRQVYASMWNFRAFEEREFHRIDHLQAAMGVVLHENEKNEQCNGVAVTRDVLYQEHHRGMLLYYVNTQVGEDLVTNPDEASVPEELLLAPRNPARDRVVQRSNRGGDESLLSAEHRDELRRCLTELQRRFAALYGRDGDASFAMECEFKVTEQGTLLIKQARPWIE